MLSADQGIMAGGPRHSHGLVGVLWTHDGDVPGAHVEGAVCLGRWHPEVICEVLQDLRDRRQLGDLIANGYVSTHDLQEAMSGDAVEELRNDS